MSETGSAPMDEYDYTSNERVDPCLSDAERPTGRPATTVDRTSTASASESRTPTTGGIESSPTAASGPSGRATTDPSRLATGASTAESSRGSAPPEDAPAPAAAESPPCPDCGHAIRLHYALGYVGCHNLSCSCKRVAVAVTMVLDTLARQLRGLAADPHARAVLSKAFREAPMANAAEALHALAEGLEAGTILRPEPVSSPVQGGSDG